MKKHYLLLILPVVILLTLGVILAFIWQRSNAIEDEYLNQMTEMMRARVALLKSYTLNIANDAPANQRMRRAVEHFRAMSVVGEMRISLIDESGAVVFDSRGSRAAMSNHADRKEVIDAREKGFGRSLRRSRTLNERMIYAAMPMVIDGRSYVIRSSIPVGAIDMMVDHMRADVIGAVLFVMLLSVLIGYAIVRNIIQPAHALAAGANIIAAGNLDHKLTIPPDGVMKDLATAFNNMAEQLKEIISTTEMEKNKLTAIFASLNEGVVLLDIDGKVNEFNYAAHKMLGLRRKSKGKDFCTIVRQRVLCNLVSRIAAGEEVEEMEIVLSLPAERHCLVRGTLVAMDQEGTKNCILLVLFDQTKVKELEQFQKNFISNVSHEIKTPLTTIQMAIETLEDGAFEDPVARRRFFRMICDHGRRLNLLIHDIMSLTALENERNYDGDCNEMLSVSDIIESCIHLSSPLAEPKHISLVYEPRLDGVQMYTNIKRVEQALLNLLDNAIKYSPSSSCVAIGALEEADMIKFMVHDHGLGIKDEDKERIFDRFFRVDQSRNRKAGGTGLGLPIVKKIAEGLGGSIEVESVFGEGSTFMISFPKGL